MAAIILSWPERLYAIALLVPDGFEAAMQRIVNQTYENMDLRSTQTLGPIPDGLMRNTPDALECINVTEGQGRRRGSPRRVIFGLLPDAARAVARSAPCA